MAWEEEGALGHEMKSHYWEVGWLPNVLWLPHYTTLRVTHLDTNSTLVQGDSGGRVPWLG